MRFCLFSLDQVDDSMLTKSDDVDRPSVALEKAILKGQLQSHSLHMRHSDLFQRRHVGRQMEHSIYVPVSLYMRFNARFELSFDLEIVLP